MLLTQLGPKAIYSVTDYWEGKKKDITDPISYSLSQPSLRQGQPRRRRRTDRGYELRSRGPAIRGFDALDTMQPQNADPEDELIVAN